jgi:hypothetical protein
MAQLLMFNFPVVVIFCTPYAFNACKLFYGKHFLFNLFGPLGSHTENCIHLTLGFADHHLVQLSVLAHIFTQGLFI